MRQDIRMISMRADSLLSANPSLTLQGLARAIGTDRHNIEHAVRKRYGFSFNELKKRYRLKRAMTLLDEQPNSYIKEIAAEIGLTPNYLSHFIRCMTGHCATAVRRQKS
jgi:AraC-like DNA-binding protein